MELENSDNLVAIKLERDTSCWYYLKEMKQKVEGLFFVFVSVLISLATILIFLSVFSNQAQAVVNQYVSFQGKLTNPDGTNVANNSYFIVFTIYSGAGCTEMGGSPCSAVWSETQSAVPVSDGIFHVNLGSVNPFSGLVDFSLSPLYLSVKVGADSEMLPRILLTSSPYAFNSQNSERLNGLGSSGFVQLAQGLQTDSSSTNASIAINKTGSTAGILQLQRSGSDVMTISNDGSYTYSMSAARNPSYSIINNGSGDIVTNLNGTGNFTILDSGTAFATFGSDGSITFAPTSTQNFVINEAAGSSFRVAATAPPTVDQVSISNVGQGVTTSGVNGLSIEYIGGSAAVEAAGLHIDYTPGDASGAVLSGLRIVEATSAGSGVSSYGIKLEGGGTGSGNSYGIELTTGWDIGLDVQSGGLQLATQDDPAAPAVGNLRIYAKEIAGRVMPKWIGPSGVDTPFQASLGFNRVAMMAPAGSGTNCGTSLSVFGSTVTGGGSCSYPALSATNLKTSVRRFIYATTGSSGNVSHHRQSALLAWRGNVSDRGGFFFTTRFGLGALANNNRAFMGLSNRTANPTNIDPTIDSSYDKIGMAINSNTGNWNFIHNRTGTAPTVINLGSNFPINTTDLYELALFSAPNGDSIGWRVKNISTGNQTSGSITTNLPNKDTFLAPLFWMTNNTTASVVQFELAGWYLESDN